MGCRGQRHRNHMPKTCPCFGSTVRGGQKDEALQRNRRCDESDACYFGSPARLVESGQFGGILCGGVVASAMPPSGVQIASPVPNSVRTCAALWRTRVRGKVAYTAPQSTLGSLRCVCVCRYVGVSVSRFEVDAHWSYWGVCVRHLAPPARRPLLAFGGHTPLLARWAAPCSSGRYGATEKLALGGSGSLARALPNLGERLD